MSESELKYLLRMQRKAKTLKLHGFTSASTDLAFVERELVTKSADQRGKIPVLMKIFLTRNINTMELNTPSLSPYY